MAVPVLILGGESSGGILLQGLKDLNRGSPEPVFECLGFLNDVLPVGTTILGYPVRGGFDDWRRMAGDARFISAIYNPTAMRARWRRIQGLAIPPERWATAIHPAAWVGDSSALAGGCYVSPGAVLAYDVQVQAHTRIGSGVNIGHECRVGCYCFVGSNASVCGRCRVGDRVHVGASSVVRDGLTIGDDVVIGIGSVVVADVPANSVVAGNPARILRQTNRD